MAISHAGHDHPATPAGRRACRAGNALVVRGTTHQTEDYIGEHIRKTAANSRMKARMDRAYGRGPLVGDNDLRARDMKMRRPAAVAARGPKSDCVQAALHTGGGRCACGWHTADYCDVSTWPCTGH